MINIEYNDSQVMTALNELMSRMGDLTPAMRDIAGVMADATERAFDNEQDPESGLAWHPLMASTVAMRGGNAHPILQNSGQLAASVVTAYGADFAQIGSNKVYAAMHQFGGTTASNSMIPGKDIQARPFLGLGDDDKEETVKNRLVAYHNQTEPLIGYYKKQGLYLEIDGTQAIDKVYADVKSSLDGRR